MNPVYFARFNSTIYQRLLASGWVKVADKNRKSYWRKDYWMATVPENINFDIRFTKSSVKFKGEK